ncbi:MAG TPA: ABC transporter substrate-binding protein [Oscillatoriaceae cyanobacterium M33_DOE_052]|uniref:ABC transporter substrate-binding protein n=1 Tax=Planktothricoides sp. SpSt-374 TaxID=2282167 RepID=A0A7C4A0J5_9CYAN|nr:ABC transporter substrate-binding protein [Oscillatoriaceae cyanobacterium M33_DOE_052]
MKSNSNRIGKYWRTGVIIALLFIISIASSGCSPARFKTKAASVPQVVFSSLSDPKTFNPPLSNESNTFGYTFEGLTSQNGITAEVEPALAESWEISPDKLRFTFTLRPGLKWSDGAPLTADDVAFTYNEIYFNPKIPNSTSDVLRIGPNRALPKVRMLDDRRVEFTLPEPFAPFLRTTGSEILPAHILRESVQKVNSKREPEFLSMWGVDTPLEQLVGNGPYVLANYQTNQRMVFQRNPYYWKQDAQGNPQPYIERVVLQIVEKQDTSLLQFRSGDLDYIGVSPETFELLKREEKRGKFTIYNGGQAMGTTFISFNLNRGRNADKNNPVVDPIKSSWFNNLKFRQAVAYGIDRQTMINNTFRGLGEPQNSHLSVQSPYYLSPEKGLKVYDYNPEKAKQLLLEAGFKYNDKNELLDAQGNLVRFTLNTNAGNQTREAMGAQIKQDLGKIGIKVDFQPIAFNNLVGKLSDSLDWECILIGFTGGVEPNNGANLWAPEGRLHIFNLNRQEGQTALVGREVLDWERKLGDLYVKGAGELDETKRKAIYNETQQLVQEHLPVIHLVNPLSLAAVRDRVKGIQYSALGGAFWNLNELKIEE